MNEIKRVAIYCRVSTEEQASEGYSITAQLQTLRNYAGLYGWQVVKEYVDEGVSGKTFQVAPLCNNWWLTWRKMSSMPFLFGKSLGYP